ncbi:tyrosine-type recombinase/integrase [Jiangella endophytica]|uniref:tyrosine-type recombinase/integrase n=1 Tax=Jiangella endophytica TaxID=1623398 RepID=UPI0038CBFF48
MWSADQLRRFLEFAKRHRLQPFFHVAAHTGARPGELLNLRWLDVDLERAEVVIRGSAAVIEGERIEGTTKGGYVRIVSIDVGTVAVLKSLRADRPRNASSPVPHGWMRITCSLVVSVDRCIRTQCPSSYPGWSKRTTGRRKGRTSCRAPDCTTCGTCTRRRCCWPVRRCAGARGRGTARTRRSRDHAARVCTRDPPASGGRGGHLRPRGRTR